MNNNTQIIPSEKNELHDGIHSKRSIHPRPSSANTSRTLYGDVWRAIVASGDKGLVIPLWWLMMEASDK